MDDREWKKSGKELDGAEDAYLEACQKYGEDSPQARAADEAAWAVADRHFGTYGNPDDHYRARY